MTFAMLTGPARRGTSICRRPRRRPYEGIGDTNEGIVDTKVLETCGAPRAAISYMTNPLHVACRQAPDASGNRAQLAPVEIHETVERNQTEDRFLPADLESRREKGRLRLLLGLNEAVASNLPVQEMIRAMMASLRAGVRCEVVAGFLSDDVAVEYSKAVAEIADLKARHAVEDLAPDGDDRDELHFGRIVGASSALRRALKQVETVSRTDSTVIVHGETGTGKELLAQAIHDLSRRRSGPFVKLNCAAIPAGLLESELFGHEKGAFTSASAQRIGRFELAHGGTIFLDEVGEISLELQPKLLRVLQEREFERLGGARTLHSDTRVIAATNHDLKTMVERGTFRSDLFYRLNVFPIHVPALRDRPEDVPLLVRHFANELSKRMNKSIRSIPCSTMSELCQYPWPGNIRELQNVVERAVILSPGPVLELDTADLKPHEPTGMADAKVETLPLRSVRDAVQQAQRDEIVRALNQAGGRVGGPEGAAARLGVKRTTLIARMKKLGIESRSAA